MSAGKKIHGDVRFLHAEERLVERFGVDPKQAPELTRRLLEAVRGGHGVIRYKSQESREQYVHLDGRLFVAVTNHEMTYLITVMEPESKSRLGQRPSQGMLLGKLNNHQVRSRFGAVFGSKTRKRRRDQRGRKGK